MYVHIHQDIKCSKCGALNQCETVWREINAFHQMEIVRCLVCGHEKVNSETFAFSTPGKPIKYEMPYPPPVKTF